jgi:hypothetical protein
MCEHTHDHEHHHEHSSPEETLALLTYMLGHNRHHAQELHDLAHGVEGEAADLLHGAVDDLGHSNDKLERALAILKGE